MRVVIDSSVSLKWWFDDEEFVAEARDLLKRVIDGGLELVLPELWYYEVANGIATAIHRNRIKKETGLEFLEELQAISFNQCEIAAHLKTILEESSRYKRSVYDMCYIVIAEKENIPLYYW